VEEVWESAAVKEARESAAVKEAASVPVGVDPGVAVPVAVEQEPEGAPRAESAEVVSA
jgi:hypothetical protein